ncbi:MAG: SpaA isopeptide-forming pilin-related protein [Bacilli bacterium]|nr:SpaA isopeptide-forming pilin-related protein [Bacilli bacterium]
MKNILKNIFLKIFLLFVACFSVSTVYAEDIASSLRMTYYTVNTPMSYPASFHVKKTTGGKYVYCAHYAKHPPVKSIAYTRGSLVKDNGINYILNKSYNASSDNSFFVYQTALWIYMIDKGIMPEPYYDITVFKASVNNSDSATARKIKSLVANAKKAAANNTSNPTISMDATGVKFTLSSDGTTYVSSPITVKSSTGNYKVTLTSAPNGSTYSTDGNKIYIKVPKSSVTSINTPVYFKVSTTKNTYRSYYYTPSDNSYQKMIVTYKKPLLAESSANLSIHSNASVEVLKTDADGKALSGATLQVKNSNGTVIDTWTTDGQKHKISNLSSGTYTLSETAAPNGYKLSTETVKFTVDATGKVKDSSGNVISLITFKNEKMSVKVSKQDIANSSEVPGAKLVIKNSEGKEIIQWTSSSKPYVIRGLAAGTYTLTETMAPDGYTKSEESITFKIGTDGKVYNADGKVIDQVIMYNKKTSTPGGVSISKQDATTGKELPGATLVVKDYDGKQIDTWVSTDTPHLIENLKAGIYTLTETIAPNGYILSNETVTFTVKDDGSVTKVVMYNSPNSKDVPSGNGGEEVPVENTGSYKTITSTVVGSLIILIGGITLFKTSKRKNQR